MRRSMASLALVIVLCGSTPGTVTMAADQGVATVNQSSTVMVPQKFKGTVEQLGTTYRRGVCKSSNIAIGARLSAGVYRNRSPQTGEPFFWRERARWRGVMAPPGSRLVTVLLWMPSGQEIRLDNENGLPWTTPGGTLPFENTASSRQIAGGIAFTVRLKDGRRIHGSCELKGRPKHYTPNN